MFPDRADRDETLEALADRLRRLPPPAVPAGLEARLLADIPAGRRPRRRLVRSWVAAAILVTAAAAAFFAVRLPRPAPPAVAGTGRPADDAPTLWRYEQALRRSDADAAVVLNQTMPTFEWPAPVSSAGRPSFRIEMSGRLINGVSWRTAGKRPPLADFTSHERSAKWANCACVAFALAPLGAAAADRPDGDLAANAALKYWQAFSTMPKVDDKTQPADLASMPLDDKACAARHCLRRLLPGADALRGRPVALRLGRSVWKRTASAPCCRTARQRAPWPA